MAWGLEARVPFLDKAFLDVAMDIDPKEKMFSKGADQETDDDGCPVMEKVSKSFADALGGGVLNCLATAVRTAQGL
jgi:Asparagine synthase